MNIEEEGDFAYYDGKELVDNPYEEDSVEFSQWRRGWFFAEEYSRIETQNMIKEYLYGF